MQQRSRDPRAVEALARRQERELRGWLGGALLRKLQLSNRHQLSRWAAARRLD